MKYRSKFDGKVLQWPNDHLVFGSQKEYEIQGSKYRQMKFAVRSDELGKMKSVGEITYPLYNPDKIIIFFDFSDEVYITSCMYEAKQIAQKIYTEYISGLH